MSRIYQAVLLFLLASIICIHRLNSILTSSVSIVAADQEHQVSPSGSFIHTTKTQDANRHHISFRLHSPDNIGAPSQFLSVQGYTCPISTTSLPPAVNHSTIFNFTTTITTDLKLLFVGDSIMQQFSQNFYSAVLLHEKINYTSTSSRDYSWGGKDGRHVILRSFINGREPLLSGLHVCSSISSPVHGGGVVGYYRLLDLPNKDGEKDYVFCKNEQGWSKTDVDELLNYELREYSGETRPLVRANSSHDSGSTTWYKSRDVGATANISKETVGKFDALVIRPPGPGWMELQDITHERILESIQLLHDLFGVETIILSTLMFNNNVKTQEDWKTMLRINAMIRDIAHTWGSESGVKYVLVQDLASLTNEILWMNARHLGYNVSSSLHHSKDENNKLWVNEGPNFLLHRLYMPEWKFNPSISMICNTPPICNPQVISLPNGTEFTNDNLCVMNISADPFQCFFNRFSRDGMHWCMETIGPRFSASIACLLGCIYNGGSGSQPDVGNVRQCEIECNQKFMSLLPVDDSWLDQGTAVYSGSKHH
jgi:hypothetical protein